MRLEDTVLRPGEFAIYLDTNGTVELGRLLAFLDCFRWINDDGLVPAYDLEVIDIQKKCIFAHFGFKWRNGQGPDEGRLSKMEHEIAIMRAQLDSTAVRMADAAEAQVDITRQALKVAAAGVAISTAIGVVGLILDVARDARSEEPTHCATAVADLMEHDHVSTIRMWAPDCTIVLEQRDIPEIQRREQAERATPMAVEPPGYVGRTLPSGEDMTQASDTDSTFPTSMHFASGNDRPRTRGPESARPASIPMLELVKGLKGTLMTKVGTIGSIGDLLLLEPEPGEINGRPMIVVPPGSYVAATGDVVEVRGRVFRRNGTEDLMIAETIIRATDMQR